MIKKHLVFLLLSLSPGFFMPHTAARPAAARTDNSEMKGVDVEGFGILKRIPGLWHGPVFSSTPAGSFDDWHVDFRPVSPGQVSQYSTLDADTLNYISFFIVKHGGRLKVAMRTEGVFQNKGCVTYEVIDRARETEGYYRFSDFQAGPRRAYTEFRFRGDGFVMEVYTSRFNRDYPLSLHSRWTAKLGDRGAVSGAMEHFNFPRPVMVKDFSDVFAGMKESIYFTFEKDPYGSASQPYVGSVNVRISHQGGPGVARGEKTLLLLTVKPLFEGIKYKKENLRYLSRYAYVPARATRHIFRNVHPGTYYLYAFNDVNNDRKHLTGDYMSSNVNNVITVAPGSTVAADAVIDFIMP